MDKKIPELVAPAGNWSALRTAVENGADAVYFGVKNLNMRDKASNFDLLEIKKVMNFLHQNGKKGYLTLNTIIMNEEIEKVRKVLKESKRINVDAVILWDMAAFSIAKELKLPIHLSTQASVSNIEEIRFFSNLGVKRIVLARECKLIDIRKIKEKMEEEGIDCEIEVFIHGAMCVSISGRCFLSQYSFGESANRGRCLQPCRREYLIKDIQDGEEYKLGKDYVLSPKDLCTVDFIDELLDAKIDAFKIEGRMRSPEYIKITTSIYRRAIENYNSGELTDSKKRNFKSKLREVYNRGFSDGFYFGAPESDKSRRLKHLYKKVYLGDVKKFYKKINVAEIAVKNGLLEKGDKILIMGKRTPARFAVADEIQKEHEFVRKVKKGEECGIKLPFRVRKKDKIFLWKKK